MNYLADIGLEVHAELNTRTKMFCSCAVVDPTLSQPNIAVCPVCEGLPGVLPVVNRQAVEFAIRVALALECTISPKSIFARKNYFYPDLPKGYQISQYESPLAEQGQLTIATQEGEKTVRIRRVHLEEDTGKLTHIATKGKSYSLIDLNRAGVPLLEIVSEPDLHSVEEASAYVRELRILLRTLGVNSGDMEKGSIRFEANVSLHPEGKGELGTRVEIKNLNSFRAMERAIDFQLEQQRRILDSGGKVEQETLGWDDTNGVTISQRSKEEAHDYRYFPEPDLPPLVVDGAWIKRVKSDLPELPRTRAIRLERELGIKRVNALLIVGEHSTANFFERAAASAPGVPAQLIANWILGELFAWMKENSETLEQLRISPEGLAELVGMVHDGRINQATGKQILAEMLKKGGQPGEIINDKGLAQVSDVGEIGAIVAKVLTLNTDEVKKFKSGKTTVEQWLFGQVMRETGGKANPAVVRKELKKQLKAE